ncbi:MAG: hypothetical protein QOH05_3518 [Acetobacteraceae bacterium]|nr:hypothetical protein [Acetobacteraceae bacterium]
MTKLLTPSCGLDAALAVIGGKWKPLILFHLAPGPRRFGELRRLVGGVSEKMLIQQLREMQADGIVERTDFKEIPPKVAYSVTSFGETLAEALKPLCAWGSIPSGRDRGYDAGAREHFSERSVTV